MSCHFTSCGCTWAASSKKGAAFSYICTPHHNHVCHTVAAIAFRKSRMFTQPKVCLPPMVTLKRSTYTKHMTHHGCCWSCPAGAVMHPSISWTCHAVMLRDCAAMDKQATHNNSMLMGYRVSLPIPDSFMQGGGGPVRTSLAELRQPCKSECRALCCCCPRGMYQKSRGASLGAKGVLTSFLTWKAPSQEMTSMLAGNMR